MKTKRLALLFMALTMAAAPQAARAADKAGDVVYLRGRAEIERAAARIPAALKTELRESDSIVTKKRARVKMLFRDDSVLTLGEKSRLVIKQYLYSPENKRAESIYELADGKLRAVVGNAGFKVTTPTAFAAARGTVFITWYDAATDSTGVAVIEGSVSVGNADPSIGGTQVVTAGQMTLVPSHQPPQPTVPFNPQGQPDTGGPGADLSDVGEGGSPAPIAPPPAPGMEGNAVVRIIPAAPPFDQTPRAAGAPVSLHLNFQ